MLMQVQRSSGGAEEVRGERREGGHTVEAHLGTVVLDADPRHWPTRIVAETDHKEVGALAPAADIQLSQH